MAGAVARSLASRPFASRLPGWSNHPLLPTKIRWSRSFVTSLSRAAGVSPVAGVHRARCLRPPSQPQHRMLDGAQRRAHRALLGELKALRDRVGDEHRAVAAGAPRTTAAGTGRAMSAGELGERVDEPLDLQNRTVQRPSPRRERDLSYTPHRMLRYYLNQDPKYVYQAADQRSCTQRSQPLALHSQVLTASDHNC